MVEDASSGSIVGLVIILVGIAVFIFAPTIEMGGLNIFMLFIAQIVGVVIAIVGGFIFIKSVAKGITGMLK